LHTLVHGRNEIEIKNLLNISPFFPMIFGNSNGPMSQSSAAGIKIMCHTLPILITHGKGNPAWGWTQMIRWRIQRPSCMLVGAWKMMLILLPEPLRELTQKNRTLRDSKGTMHIQWALLTIERMQGTITWHQNQEVRKVVLTIHCCRLRRLVWLLREIKPCLHHDILDREVEVLIHLIMRV